MLSIHSRDGGRRRDQVSQALLEDLSSRQHLWPHRPVGQVLADAQQRLFFGSDAAQSALAWLKLNGQEPVGRLRRADLIQLARCVCRFEHPGVDTPAR